MAECKGPFKKSGKRLDMGKIRVTSIVAIFMAVAAFSAFAAPKQAAKTTAKQGAFTFLTANVGTAELSKGDLKREFKISEYDLPVLRENINAIDPDIVFLQEIDSEGLHQENRIFFKKYSVRCQGELCIALKTEKFDFLGDCESGNGYFTCPAHALTAKPLQEKCEFKDGGYICRSIRKLENKEVIRLVNVHTVSPLSDKEFKTRREQICGLIDDIRKMNDAGMKVLTSGDFNFDPYRYKSAGYEKNDNKDDLLKAGVCWANAFDDPEASKLKVINGDAPTWFVDFKVLFVEKHLMYTLDHIITNMRSGGCKVLKDNKQRLDIALSEKGSSKAKTFMDHRGLLCSFTVE